MNTLDLLWLAWSWIGFGGGLAVLVLLCTNHLHSNISKSRWKDVVWLSWLMVLIYLVHVCEEYGMHIVDGQFYMVQSFIDSGINERFGKIPLYFFPYVNIVFTWIALPIAAVLSKKNPIIGLSGIGFLLVNGITHLGACVIGGTSPIKSPGSVSGIFAFIPFFVWVVYICKKEKLLPKKGIGIAIASGVIGHALLFSMYLLNKVAGHTAAAIYVPIVTFSPLIIAWLLCKVFKIKV